MKLLENIKIYYIIGSSIALAILAYLFMKRGEKIGDLTFQLISEKIDAELIKERTKLLSAKELSNQTINEYTKKRRKFKEVLEKYRGRPE